MDETDAEQDLSGWSEVERAELIEDLQVNAVPHTWAGHVLRVPAASAAVMTGIVHRLRPPATVPGEQPHGALAVALDVAGTVLDHVPTDLAAQAVGAVVEVAVDVVIDAIVDAL
jgi:hypothetical protein